MSRLIFNYNNSKMIFKNNIKRLPSVITCAGRLYSTKNNTSLRDAPLAGARINEIIQLISNTKTFNTALTHKSYISVDSSAKSYDTLEYLGDSILQFYTTLFLFNSYPELAEGKLNDKRTQLVEGKNLSSISLKIGLHKYLRMGADKKDIDFNNKSLAKKDSKILADIYESFIAALYIEKGENLLNEFITLTVLDKPEFNKLFKLNTRVAKIIVPTSATKVMDTDSALGLNHPTGDSIIETLGKVPGSDNEIVIKSIINSSDDNKDKFSIYMDKSLNNQKEIVELLIKMYVLIEYNFKTKVSVRGVIQDNSPPEGFL